jgi:hypothetical protein
MSMWIFFVALLSLAAVGTIVAVLHRRRSTRGFAVVPVVRFIETGRKE